MYGVENKAVLPCLPIWRILGIVQHIPQDIYSICCSPSLTEAKEFIVLTEAKEFRLIRGTFGRRPLAGRWEGGSDLNNLVHKISLKPGAH